MDVREAGQPRDLLVEARVVLHRAGAEREKAEINRVILARQARVMAHRFRLAEPWKVDRARTFEPAEPRRALRDLSKVDAGLIGRADLEQQRLLKHERAIAGHGLRLALLVGGGGGPPARRIDGHWTTSFKAASRA